MKSNGRAVPHRDIWTYGYVLVPPITRDRMGPMEALLEGGHTKARLAALTWEGRLVNGNDITHILVVSDTPDQNLEINQQMEAELHRLEAPFAVTAAMAVGGASTPGGSLGPVGAA
jgi:hypothetical protein